VDRGEADAIALALEINADLLVIDDRRGRAAAARRGMAVIGSVGLLEARTRGLAPQVRALLEDLGARRLLAQRRRPP
jgi:predicted nucleic acid-binding protein